MTKVGTQMIFKINEVNNIHCRLSYFKNTPQLQKWTAAPPKLQYKVRPLGDLPIIMEKWILAHLYVILFHLKRIVDAYNILIQTIKTPSYLSEMFHSYINLVKREIEEIAHSHTLPSHVGDKISLHFRPWQIPLNNSIPRTLIVNHYYRFLQG